MKTREQTHNRPSKPSSRGSKHESPATYRRRRTLAALGTAVVLSVATDVAVNQFSGESRAETPTIATLSRVPVDLDIHTNPYDQNSGPQDLSIVLHPGVNLRKSPEIPIDADGNPDDANVVYAVPEDEDVTINMPVAIEAPNGDTWYGGYASVNGEPTQAWVDVSQVAEEQLDYTPNLQLISYQNSISEAVGQVSVQIIK